ncbi:MAG: ABC transporter permease, partial [Candidatus Eisenbacteria bacterium]|nr:ABC transporter permease [Candidatus Eisenbacteria bacterium]
MNGRDNRALKVWLLAPAITFVVVVGAFPVLSQFVLSFADWNLKFADERGFVGLANFVELAGDVVFWRDLWQT